MRRVLVALTLAQIGFSNPTNPSVVSGSASFINVPNSLTVNTTSDRTIIEWDAFSIGVNELTFFSQPTVTSAVLNRVIQNNLSNIQGSLRSNGSIFLINPEGIVFDTTARVDVGGLVASSLDVMNAEFLAGGAMTFSGGSVNGVNNAGEITANQDGVYFFGRNLVNTNTLSAPGSTVGLGAGSSIILQADGSLTVVPGAGPIQVTGITDKGDIEGAQIVLMADGSLYSGAAINMSGSINATKTQVVDGEIFLYADQGEVLLSDQGSLSINGSGDVGTITVLGETLTLQDSVEISTSNEYGTGNIYIGTTEAKVLPDAATVFLGAGVLVDSTTTLVGNGGNVDLIATGMNQFFGKIDARGGYISGNGATVEVSGGVLNFMGTVDTTAPRGLDGMLIIDPTDFTIGAADANLLFTPGSPGVYSGTAATSSLSSATLNTTLQTTNILVTTASAFGSAGNITFAGPVNLTLVAPSTSRTLTFFANNNVTFNSAFTFTDTVGSTSHFIVNATNDITVNSAITGNSLQEIQLNAGNDLIIDNSITNNNNSIIFTATRDIINQGGGTNTLTMDTLTATAGRDISNNANLAVTGSLGASSSANLTATTGDITFNNLTTTNNIGSVTFSTLAGNIVLDQNVSANTTDNYTLNSASDIIIQGGTVLLNDLTGGQTIFSLIAGNDIQFNSQLDLNNALEGVLEAGNDIVIDQDFEPDDVATIRMSAGRDVRVQTAGDVLVVDVTTLTCDAGRDIFVDNPRVFNVTGVANTTMTADQDIQVLGRIFNGTTGNLSTTATRDVLVGPSAGVAQIGTQIGTLTVGAGNDLTLTGGTGGNDRAQVGFSSANVMSDIVLNVTGDITLSAGTTGSNQIAQIGHGFTNAGTRSGDIIFNTSPNNVTLNASPAGGGTIKFAQIGHNRFTSGVSNVSGDIRGPTPGSFAVINGTLSLNANNDSTSFALFGHGGRASNANETYSGNIRVRANLIDMNAGNNPDAFACIGFHAINQGGGANPVIVNNASVEVASNTDINMNAATPNGIVNIGARALVTAAHASTLNLDLVSVTTGGDLNMTSGTGVESDATIGAFTDFGTAASNLTTSIAGNLNMTAGTGAPARIVNTVGSGTANTSNVAVSGNLTITTLGAQEAYIESASGSLAVAAGGLISMPAMTRIENLGGSNGTLSVTGGAMLVQNGGFIRNAGTGTTAFRTTTGNLNLLSSSFISSIGSATGSIARDLLVSDNANVTVTGGSLSVDAERNISVSGSAAGPSFLSSAGEGRYNAGNSVNLFGSSLVNEAYIENTSSDLTVIGGVDVNVDIFGRITNQGSEDLTIVVDNQAPSSPQIGDGSFFLSNLGSVGRAGGGPLRIFTARQSQNIIQGTANVNGNTFSAGTPFLNTATEIWGTYFPSTLGGSPFTFFYKDDLPVPAPTLFDLLAINPNAIIPFYELFYILERPQDPYLAWLYRLVVIENFDFERDLLKGEEGVYNEKIFDNDRVPPQATKMKVPS